VSGLAEQLGVPLGPELLVLALTHRSFAYENGGIPHNERLEFLGDSILGQAVTVMLYTENPLLDEGELAKRRASLVSTVALAEVARSIGLGQFIRLGRGEELTGGHDKSSILADTVEAVIGAVYIECGGEAATAFVLRLIRPLLEDPEKDSGPDHSKRFHAVVTLAGKPVANGTGTSKKQAEMSAALEAWTLLQLPAEQ
jgi:ribonuclease-3